MLCKPFDGHSLEGQWIVEPKIDGVRALINVDTQGNPSALSRNKKPLWNLHHVFDEIKERNLSNVTLDCEIWNGKSFDETSGITRRQYRDPNARSLMCHVFDVLVPGISPTLATRKQYLRELIAERVGGTIVTTKYLVAKPGVPWSMYSHAFHRSGYEGAVFKLVDGVYTPGRAGTTWYKVKPVHECDMRVIGMIQGDGKYADTLGALKCVGIAHWRGQEYNVSCNLSGMDDDMRHGLWRLRHNIDALPMIQVEFQEVTQDGSLRFPRFIRLRDDK